MSIVKNRERAITFLHHLAYAWMLAFLVYCEQCLPDLQEQKDW